MSDLEQYSEFGTDARAESVDHGQDTGFAHKYGEFGTDGRAESIEHGPAVFDHSYGEFGTDGRAESIDHEATLAALSYGEFGVDGRGAVDHGPSAGFAHQYGEFGIDRTRIPANIPIVQLVQRTATFLLRGMQEGADYAMEITSNPNLKGYWPQVVQAVYNGVGGGASGVGRIPGLGAVKGSAYLNHLESVGWLVPENVAAKRAGLPSPSSPSRGPSRSQSRDWHRGPSPIVDRTAPRPEQLVRHPDGRPVMNSRGQFVKQPGTGGYGNNGTKAWGWGTGPNDIRVNRIAFENVLKQRNALARKYDLNRFEIAHLRSEPIPRPSVLYVIAAASGPSFTGDATAAPPITLDSASPPTDVMAFQSMWNQAGGTPPLPVDGVFDAAVAAAKRLWDCGTYGGSACAPEFGADGCGTIGAGSTPSAIAAWQQCYNASGAVTSGNSPAVSVTGVFDQATSDAVAAQTPMSAAGLNAAASAVLGPVLQTLSAGYEGMVSAAQAGDPVFAQQQLEKGETRTILVNQAAFENLIRERNSLLSLISRTNQVLARLRAQAGRGPLFSLAETTVLMHHPQGGCGGPSVVYQGQAPVVPVEAAVEAQMVVAQPVASRGRVRMPTTIVGLPSVSLPAESAPMLVNDTTMVAQVSSGPDIIDVNRDAFFNVLKQRNRLARRLDILRAHLAMLARTEAVGPLVQYVVVDTAVSGEYGMGFRGQQAFGAEGQIAAAEAGDPWLFAAKNIARGKTAEIAVSKASFQRLIRERDRLLQLIDSTLQQIARYEDAGPDDPQTVRWVQGHSPSELKVNRDAFRRLVQQRNGLWRNLQRLRWRVAKRERSALPPVPVLYIVVEGPAGGPGISGDIACMGWEGQRNAASLGDPSFARRQIENGDWRQIEVSRNTFRTLLKERRWLLSAVKKEQQKLAWLEGGHAHGDPTAAGSASALSASPLTQSASTTVNAATDTLQRRALEMANALLVGKPDAFSAAQMTSQSAANGDWVSRQFLDAVRAILWKDTAPFFVKNAVEWRTNGAGVVGPGPSTPKLPATMPAPTASAVSASASMNATPPAASPSGYMPSAVAALQTALQGSPAGGLANGAQSAQAALGSLGGMFGDPPDDPSLHPQVRANIASCVRAADLGDQVSMAQLVQLRKAALQGDPDARRQFRYALAVAKASMPQPAFGVAFGKESRPHAGKSHAQKHAPAQAHHAAAAKHAEAAKHASDAANKHGSPSAKKAADAHAKAANHHAEAAKHSESAKEAEGKKHDAATSASKARTQAEHAEAAKKHAAAARLAEEHHAEAVKHEVMAKRASHEAAEHAKAAKRVRDDKERKVYESRDDLRKRADARHPAFQDGSGGGGGGGGGASSDGSGYVVVADGGGGPGRAEPPLHRLVRAAAGGNPSALHRIHRIKTAAYKGDTRAQSMLTALRKIAAQRGTASSVSGDVAALSHGRPLTTSRVGDMASEFGADAVYVIEGVRKPHAVVDQRVNPVVRRAIVVGQKIGRAQELQAQRFPNGPVPSLLAHELY